jgi:integrase
MTIVTLSDAYIQRLAATDRRILRDRILSGFCLRMNKRSRTFMVATSSKGKQVRVTIGRWPIVSADEARSVAAKLLRDCRRGDMPRKQLPRTFPTLEQLLPLYAEAKGIKASSRARYESMLKVHFSRWQGRSVQELSSSAFARDCHDFASSRGAALVEVGSGLIGAIVKYINAVYGLQIENPFRRLAAAGLMPDRAKPREQRLQRDRLKEWHEAVSKLPASQKDLLMLLALTGLRRNEGGTLRVGQIDLSARTLHVPETKNGESHTLPITPMMREILVRRCAGLQDEQLLFEGVSLDHLAEKAIRAGAPNFMLHDLRKILATTGQQLCVTDAVMRRILNHKAKRSDTLHRHYIRLSCSDVVEAMIAIQQRLSDLWVGSISP